MKKLTVIVKPANREDVIDIMESCAVYGVMETDITGYGNQKGYRVMYRGTMSGPNVLMKCKFETCLLYTSPSPRDGLLSRMPSSA